MIRRMDLEISDSERDGWTVVCPSGEVDVSRLEASVDEGTATLVDLQVSRTDPDVRVAVWPLVSSHPERAGPGPRTSRSSS